MKREAGFVKREAWNGGIADRWIDRSRLIAPRPNYNRSPGKLRKWKEEEGNGECGMRISEWGLGRGKREMGKGKREQGMLISDCGMGSGGGGIAQA